MKIIPNNKPKIGFKWYYINEEGNKFSWIIIDEIKNLWIVKGYNSSGKISHRIPKDTLNEALKDNGNNLKLYRL